MTLSDTFHTPSLHILPNGTVLPWYGLPNVYKLWKYPGETLESVSQNKIVSRMNRFFGLIDSAKKKVATLDRQAIDFDNIIALYLNNS